MMYVGNLRADLPVLPIVNCYKKQNDSKAIEIINEKILNVLKSKYHDVSIHHI